MKKQNSKSKKHLVDLKDMGNKHFTAGQYAQAVKAYEAAIEACKVYNEAWGPLPVHFKYEMMGQGGEQKLKEDQMYQHELARLKAQLHNNISATLCKVGSYEQADLANSLALIEDPDYAKAMHRLILIKEEMGQYQSALEMCNFALMRYDSPEEAEEDPDNAKVVP